MKWIEHPLPNGRVSLVSICDRHILLQFKSWHVTRSRSGRYYMATSIKREDGSWTKKLFHSLVFPDAETVNHIDHDETLDNRRSNLEPCTRSQNNGYTRPRLGRKYKGVIYLKRGKFAAQVNGHWLGTYETEIEAALAYDDGARAYFGQFAYLNFPREGERGLYPEFHQQRSAA